MNKQIRELAESAFDPINALATEGIADRHTFEQAWFQLYNQKFAEAIVAHIVGKIEQEAVSAWEQDQLFANASLLALSLEILEDFDMELPEHGEFDQEGNEE